MWSTNSFLSILAVLVAPGFIGTQEPWQGKVLLGVACVYFLALGSLKDRLWRGGVRDRADEDTSSSNQWSLVVIHEDEGLIRRSFTNLSDHKVAKCDSWRFTFGRGIG